MVSKKRQPRGKTNGRAKLTPEQVIQIRQKRRLGISLGVLSKEYGVSKTTISWIAKRRLWKHLGDDITLS
jgi:hypothetical protein